MKIITQAQITKQITVTIKLSFKTTERVAKVFPRLHVFCLEYIYYEVLKNYKKYFRKCPRL